MSGMTHPDINPMVAGGLIPNPSCWDMRMTTRPTKKGRALFQHPLHGRHGAQRDKRVTGLMYVFVSFSEFCTDFTDGNLKLELDGFP